MTEKTNLSQITWLEGRRHRRRPRDNSMRASTCSANLTVIVDVMDHCYLPSI